MSHAFIEQDAFVALRPTLVYRETRDMSFALEDLRREGFEHLEEIAQDYSISPIMLMGRYVRIYGDVS